MLNDRLKARIGRVAVIALLAAPTAAVVTGGVAWAGQSTKTNGCYVTWGNTAWSAKCAPASQGGWYYAHVSRAWQSDYTGPWRSVSFNSTATFDSGEAWNGVQSTGNYVGYKGN